MFQRKLILNNVFYCAIIIIFFSSISKINSTFAHQNNPDLIDEYFLKIDINNVETKEVIITLFYKKKLFLPEDFLEKFRISYTDWPAIIHDDKKYYSIPKSKETKISIDKKNSILNLKLSPSVFKNQEFKKKNKLLKYNKPENGFYINYEAVISKFAENKTTNINTFNEFIWFNNKGNFFSSFTLNRIDNSNKLTRLETRFEKDYPISNRTLIIGDGRTAPGLWGGPILFGGIQYKNNFLLTPEFLPYPLPNIKGQAALPSVVDVFVNDNLTGRFDANIGPFSIFSIPTVSGNGTIKVIQKDVLGQQTVFEVPFYTSPILLKKGLTDYEFNIGATRNEFYSKSNLYSKLMTNAFYRIGLTDKITTEIRGEALRSLQNIGIGSSFSNINFGTITLAQVISNNNKNTDNIKKKLGSETRIIYTHSNKYFNTNLNIEYFSKNYASLGQYYNQPPPKINAQTFVSIPLFLKNSLALSYVYRYNRDFNQERISKIFTGNYTHNLLDKFFINLSTNYDLNNKSTQFFIYFSANNKDYNTSYSNIYQKPNKPIHNIMLNKMSNKLYSLDYDVRFAQQTGNNNFSSELFYKTDYADYNLGYEKQGNLNNYRFQTDGSIILLKNLFLTRRIDDSFAIVDTDKVANIDIYQNNVKVGKTDKQGLALIRNINSFTNNRISLNTKSIPFEYAFNKSFETITPFKNTGNIINFKLLKISDGSFILVDKHGNPIIDGATGVRKEDNYEFTVGYDGFVYFNNLLPKNTLEISWKSKNIKIPQRCYVYFEYSQKPNEIQPELGVFQCVKYENFKAEKEKSEN